MTGKRPWLAPGLSIARRCELLIAECQRGGWKIVNAPGNRLSMTDPITKRFRLSTNVLRFQDGAPVASPLLAYTLAHELKHKRQFGDNRFIAAAKLAAYMSNRKVRLSMEVEAEAEEAACRFAINGKLDMSADSLSGFKYPYFTGAEEEKVRAMILNLATEILVEEGLR